ncbi:hypothetical protein CDV31_016768 [Fusarium ambrosium]|uniref:PD-(D/E)XK nuclease-like domain-containing protein n=1 Tax=Fusarium ambrosium TaxID=131363 RepID=A0A428S291_9HYPO|nr:hypothetical protein CDV31_016768 [Fusarium ambrosium]
MHPLIIQAWVDEVQDSATAPQPKAHRRRLSDTDAMPSPSKRARTSDPPPPDPDQTPTRPPHQPFGLESDEAVFDDATSTHSKSSFTALLSSGLPFSAPTTLPLAPRSRSISPSKQFRTTAKLLDLAVPVRFMKEPDPESALPEDAQPLFKALSAVENKEGIIPEGLRAHPDFRRVRGHMWRPCTKDEDEAALLANYATLRNILDCSTRSANRKRCEASWNNLVHTPLLLHTLSSFAHLEVEPIPSARIMPAFRPLTKTGDAASVSSASSASGQDPGTPKTTAAVGVHKMVDYAVVLLPDADLESAIDTFLARQPHTMATINQTRYEPLRTCPAPIFIETKTAAGNMETANVQLGIWVAAWHQRMRSIIEFGGGNHRVITIPVIQVVGTVWTLLFVVDAGTEIRVIDWSFRIGDTDTIVGVYQLHAAMLALGDWVKKTFEPWFTLLLSRAIS